MLILHGYFRSSAAFRVRIALALKGLPHASVSHHLRRGDHRAPAFLNENPQGLVPALTVDGVTLNQSLAIIEYLDEVYPEPPLLPPGPLARARVRAIALQIACDIHPLNNLRVLRHLEQQFGQNADQQSAWARHWIEIEFGALEARLAREAATGRFCHGDAPSLADVCLVPQVFNARCVATDLAPYPAIRRITDACLALAPFALAVLERQPDAE